MPKNKVIGRTVQALEWGETDRHAETNATKRFISPALRSINKVLPVEACQIFFTGMIWFILQDRGRPVRALHWPKGLVIIYDRGEGGAESKVSRHHKYFEVKGVGIKKNLEGTE